MCIFFRNRVRKLRSRFATPEGLISLFSLFRSIGKGSDSKRNLFLLYLFLLNFLVSASPLCNSLLV
jgi:hypothetical protein